MRLQDGGRKNKRDEKMMTTAQKNTIEKLTRDLGLGTRADQGVKHVLGKMPINMSESRAASVISSLRSKYAASDAASDAADDLNMALHGYAD